MSETRTRPEADLIALGRGPAPTKERDAARRVLPDVRGTPRWVLAVLPPYTMWRLDQVRQPGAAGQRVAPWMPAALPLLRQILAESDIQTRLVRFRDEPFEYPPELFELTRFHYWRGTTIEEHLEEMARVARSAPAFFDQMVESLLEGDEQVFGFSVYRLNVGVTLRVAKRLKECRPTCRIILGGPEAGESPGDLQMPWVDCVVTGMGDRVVSAVVTAALNDEVARVDLPSVWINPSAGARGAMPSTKGYHAVASYQVPVLRYEQVLELLREEATPVVPALLNVGCPFDCGFCTNRTVYPEFIRSPVERVVRELRHIAQVWSSFFEGEPKVLRVMFCDATVNAEPAQFEALTRALCDDPLPDWIRLDANVVVDERITPERVELIQRAGFRNLFFGLESASHPVRRDMKKPGRMDAVLRGMEQLRDYGPELSVTAGLVIGWPNETEEYFEESLRFVETLGGQGTLKSLAITLLAVFPGAQNTTLLDGNRGEHRGLLWDRDVPAGSVELRARRFLEVYERLRPSAIRVISALEPAVIFRWMLGETRDEVIGEWVDAFDPDAKPRAASGSGMEGRESGDTRRVRRLTDSLDELLRPSMSPAVATAGFALAEILGTEHGILLVVDRNGESLVLRVEPAVEGGPAYRRQDGFAFSYQDWTRQRLELGDLDRLIRSVAKSLPGLDARAWQEKR